MVTGVGSSRRSSRHREHIQHRMMGFWRSGWLHRPDQHADGEGFATAYFPAKPEHPGKGGVAVTSRTDLRQATTTRP
jgi:hypothetical protein